MWILWGSDSQDGDEPTLYEFETEAELLSFMHGVDEGCGWLDYTVFESEEDFNAERQKLTEAVSGKEDGHD